VWHKIELINIAESFRN